MPVFRSNLKSMQIQDAERTTIRLARFARSMSILKNSDCVLSFSDKQITLNFGTNQTESITRSLPADVKIESFQNTANSRRRSSEERDVTFYPSGMNDGFRITFSAGSDLRSEIVCSPVTAKTTVKN